MRILGVIPSRYASTRLPGKPLVDIGGKSMVQRVVEQARLCGALDAVVVATDDERVAEHVRSFGGDVVMTSPAHPSGTDCIAFHRFDRHALRELKSVLQIQDAWIRELATGRHLHLHLARATTLHP